MMLVEVILTGIAIGLVLLPCRFDPAIRWKARNEARRETLK